MRIVDYGDVLLICMFFSILFIVIIGIIIRNHYKEKYERELKLQISLYEEDNKTKMEDFKFQISFLKDLINVVVKKYKNCSLKELHIRLFVLEGGLEILDSKFNKDNK